jgi:hypothetical protein
MNMASPKPDMRLLKTYKYKNHTLEQVDYSDLAEEIKVRQVKCEAFQCTDRAVFMIPELHPAFVCDTHLNMYVDNPDQLLTLVVTKISQSLSEIINAAFDNSEHNVAIVYK